MSNERVEELEKQITELKSRWPAHSVPPMMFQRLEELEEELERELKKAAEGETDAQAIRQQMTDLIQKEPLAEIDYVSIAHAETLDELDTVKSPALVSMAVRAGKTRLIDNVVLE